MLHSCILVGDIGGTNARFGLVRNGELKPYIIGYRRAANFETLEAAIRDFLAEEGKKATPERASIAVACPVNDDFINLTNNHWQFSAKAMAESLGLKELRMLNDFTAQALAVPHLQEDELSIIGPALPPSEKPQPIAVLGPGTGLGVSGLVPAGAGWTALSGEGGHMSIAPENELEIEILRYALKEYDRVSVERFLCGSGLAFLYRALSAVRGIQTESLHEAEIVSLALTGNSDIARETVHQFCAFLGHFAGDVALLLGARAGVYIGGGIVPRFGALFGASPFRERFERKGRFRAYNSTIPTFLISPHDDPALIGAASVFI